MIILVFIFVGLIVGYALRRVNILKKVNQTMPLTICVMLFTLGITVGNNSELLGNIGNYSWQALVLSIAGLAGSILFTIVVSSLFFKNAKDEKGGSNE